MDEYVAKQLETRIIGQTVGGYRVDRYINHGKSAAVFEGKKGAETAAIKIFDPEIVERFGRETQHKRIEREKCMIGKRHPNLVAVYDAGEHDNLFYVIMEFFDGPNLADALKDIPKHAVRSLIAQIARAAKYLESESLAHRDIKPENIGISSDLTTAKLLDFGVLRPLDLSNITDEGEQRFFIGTLQYSPPELLFREEEPTTEAWRAISFYQIGAVIHDLIMKKPLFEEFKHPYARLVRAVEREIPFIVNEEADADIRLLSQNCLIKNPRHRLDTVTWDDFDQPRIVDPLDSARRRIAQHIISASQKECVLDGKDLLSSQAFALRTSVFSSVVATTKKESFPRYIIQNIREPHPYLLRIVFDPCQHRGLSSFFAVYCLGQVLSSEANIQEINVWACIGPSRELLPAEPLSSMPSRVIKGALIEQDIRQHIHESLVIAYADALDLSKRAPSDVKWIIFGRYV